MSLRPPSTSPSPSPTPSNKTSSRASMGPSSRPAPINLNPPASPRPGSGRPTSELLGSAGLFQTPEAEAIDQWFENLQNYEATLEEMAAASLDVNFKEELSAIEQWFRVLSEAERTAALYSLLQHSTQVQIRFFITVLQQMARSDPMSALLSPSVGAGSMQSQMEAKLAQMGLKSPGLKSSVPASPSARNFSGGGNPNRQSLIIDSSTASSFLSPDSANVLSPPANNDAAATLAQQRAKLKANAAHRISAPALASTVENARNVWNSVPASQLSQVAERTAEGPAQELTIPSPPVNNSSSRPKSTDFSGIANALRSPRVEIEDSPLSPMVAGNWASMVNTPLVPMFEQSQITQSTQNLDSAAAKLANWQMGNNGRGGLDDNRKYPRSAKSSDVSNQGNGHHAIYGDDGNVISHQQAQMRGGLPNSAGGFRSASGNNGSGNAFFGGSNPGSGGGGQNWNGAGGTRSPALASPGRFGGEDLNGMNPGGFNMGMPSAGLAGMGMGMAGLGMGQLSPFNMNMLSMANLGAMGLSPEAQLLAAQMAANGFVQPGLNSPFGMGMQQQQQAAAAALSGMRNVSGGRGPGLGGGQRLASGGAGNKPSGGRDGGKDKEEDVDPSLLGDIPAWLRSLRLHKYTPNFEGMKWQDMVALDDAALEAKGVAALGARRKMLKTFEVVRMKMGINGGHSPGSPNRENSPA